MQISNDMALLNIQNQLNQNALQLTKAAVATDVMIDSSNIQQVMPDLTQLMVEQVQMPIAYQANANAISVQNAVQDAILDIKAWLAHFILKC